jgi:uncharacterized protein (TIGR02145 family)
MKKIRNIILTLVMCNGIFAQSPDAFKYQAVARDASGNILANTAVSFRISILSGSVTGTVVYTETHTGTTNSFGLVDLEIGKGTNPIGTFSGIAWGDNTYFVKVEMDPAGGTTFQDMGTSQLLSVPYALHAKDAATKAYVDAIVSKLSSTGAIVADAEGNIISTVRIGSQIWMAENLKTTKYNDDTTIPLVTNNIDWSVLTTPGYCWYDNNEANKDTYGALYNWYTVKTNKLCPAGWHVPSDADWILLENYLIANGYNWDGTTTGNRIAKSLASAFGWASSTYTGAVGNTDYPGKRNASGFTALPSGQRSGSGSFNGFGFGCSLWSSSELNGTNAWSCHMHSQLDDETILDTSKKAGYSVRCLKD